MSKEKNLLFPKWMEKKKQLKESQLDPLSKTIKNQPFRELAAEFLEEGQLLCYFNIVDFKLYNYQFGFEEGDLLQIGRAHV